jgi:hypothetical protein
VRATFAAVASLGGKVAAVAGGAALALAAGACGGGERQDAGESASRYEVAVTRASFPARQQLSAEQRLVVDVQNTGSEALPDVAVTVDGLSTRSERADLADPDHPVWIVGEPPAGGTTATATTWALGRLAPGATKRFEWRVSPARSGTHKIHWRVAAGLGGRAEAVLKGNRTPEGDFTVVISGRPSASRVDPETGAVIRTSR